MSADETRSIRVFPAFHRCNDDPKKNYGISEPRLVWTLHVGPDAISWELCTGWGMPTEAFHAACPGCHHPRHQRAFPSGGITAGAVDWHLSTPAYEGMPFTEHCKILDGPCYADVGFLLGDELFDKLRVEGDEAVWLLLRSLLVDYRSSVAS